MVFPASIADGLDTDSLTCIKAEAMSSVVATGEDEDAESTESNAGFIISSVVYMWSNTAWKKMLATLKHFEINLSCGFAQFNSVR